MVPEVGVPLSYVTYRRRLVKRNIATRISCANNTAVFHGFVHLPGRTCISKRQEKGETLAGSHKT